MTTIAIICALLGMQGAAASETPLDRWADAAGGRAKLAAITSTYREATIEVAGHSGAIKVWRTPEGKYRKEERIGPFVLIETFDGATGMLQKGANAPQPMNPAELARARSTAFANSNAVFFAAFPERRRGTVTVESADTVVLRPEGGIDWRVTLDPDTGLPRSMAHAEGVQTITVEFPAYEIVDGIRFEKELRRSTGDPRMNAVIRFTKTVINPPIEAAIFSIEDATAPPEAVQ